MIAQKSIEKKQKRGDIGHSVYTYKYDGNDGIVKLEVHQKALNNPISLG